MKTVYSVMCQGFSRPLQAQEYTTILYTQALAYISFILIAGYHFIMRMYHNVFIHFTLDGHWETSNLGPLSVSI